MGLSGGGGRDCEPDCEPDASLIEVAGFNWGGGEMKTVVKKTKK